MKLPNNTLLQGGKYKIIRFISSGGFGCTYEAEHVMLHKRVAIKEFFVKDFCNRDEHTAHVTVGTQSKKELVEKLRRKFVDEAVTLSALSHPSIVHVSDVFEENGTAYFAMDYIDGPSLSDLIRKNGSLSESKALYYIRQVCSALQYIHNNNRLHLDIKPSNIMIDKNTNCAILIDFGASKQYEEENGENTSTLMGKTPGYAPLEQMGNNVVKFLPATDIYALGATLYKSLTGITPPPANMLASGETLDQLPSIVSADTTAAITAAMQLNKKNRPQTIKEFLAFLGENTDVQDDVTVIESATPPRVNNHSKKSFFAWVDKIKPLPLIVIWAVLYSLMYFGMEYGLIYNTFSILTCLAYGLVFLYFARHIVTDSKNKTIVCWMFFVTLCLSVLGISMSAMSRLIFDDYNNFIFDTANIASRSRILLCIVFDAFLLYAADRKYKAFTILPLLDAITGLYYVFTPSVITRDGTDTPAIDPVLSMLHLWWFISGCVVMATIYMALSSNSVVAKSKDSKAFRITGFLTLAVTLFVYIVLVALKGDGKEYFSGDTSDLTLCVVVLLQLMIPVILFVNHAKTSRPFWHSIVTGVCGVVVIILATMMFAIDTNNKDRLFLLIPFNSILSIFYCISAMVANQKCKDKFNVYKYVAFACIVNIVMSGIMNDLYDYFRLVPAVCLSLSVFVMSYLPVSLKMAFPKLEGKNIAAITAVSFALVVGLILLINPENNFEIPRWLR